LKFSLERKRGGDIVNESMKRKIDYENEWQRWPYFEKKKRGKGCQSSFRIKVSG